MDTKKSDESSRTSRTRVEQSHSLISYLRSLRYVGWEESGKDFMSD